jgi:transcription initiation factor TFIIIB Brf1 subunit/transcription initiation factor TFIIB
MRLCSWCDGEVNEIHHGDEGWSVCSECGCVEGETYEVNEPELRLISL